MREFHSMPDRDFVKPRNYIGASDMGALAGVDKYRTRVQVYEDLMRAKQGLMPLFSGNAACTAGHDLESLVLSKFISERWGESHAKRFMLSRLNDAEKFQIVPKNGSLRDFENTINIHSWTEVNGDESTAHPDLLIIENGKPLNVQAKVTTFMNTRTSLDPRYGYDKKDLTQTGLALATYFQVQAEMHVFEIEESFVCVMHGYDHRTYGPIDYNAEVAALLMGLASKMMICVENDTPPEPVNFEDLMLLYPDVNEGSVLELEGIQGEDMANDARTYETASERMKKAEELKKNAKFFIGRKMKDYHSCTVDGVEVVKMRKCRNGRYPVIGKDFK